MYLCTFPRSGSHFFAEAFKKSTGINVQKVKSIPPHRDQAVVTIIRNPIDCLSSIVAMEYSAVDNVEDLARGYISYYSDFYKEIYNKAHISLAFEDVISDINQAIADVCEPLRLSYKTIDPDSIVIPPSSPIRIDSSRVLSEYPDFIEMMNGYDLSDCYKYYDRMKDRNKYHFYR